MLTDFQLANTLTLSDGSTVEWERIGDPGLPPLVWVEGGPGIWAHLGRPDVELVSDLFCCHLVNAPGCGRTSPPADASGYELEALIAWWEQVREALGLEQVTLMGHSWGGVVAPAWAAAHPEPIDRLIVINGYPGGTLDHSNPDLDFARIDAEYARNLARHEGAPYVEAATAALADEESENAAGEPIGEEESNRTFAPAWPLYFSDPTTALSAPHVARITSDFRYNVAMSRAWFGPDDPIDRRTNTLPSLAAVRCPAIVIAGEHDLICGPEWNRPIAAAIPGARYVEIADAGHLPQYEQPEAFRAAVLDWLRKA
jgi:proline iminopeptidase